jgi:hypothetical protein
MDSRRNGQRGRHARGPEIEKRLAQLERQLAALVSRRVDAFDGDGHPMSDPLDRVQENAGDLERHNRELGVQFTRIAQIQADLDEIKQALRRRKIMP